MEAFLVVVEEVLKELTAKGSGINRKVGVELKLIKELTGRLSSHKIEKRWSKLLTA